MKTKNSMPSAFQVFKRKRPTKAVTLVKIKKRKVKNSLTNEPNDQEHNASDQEPIASTSTSEPRIHPGGFKPLLDSDVERESLIPCGNIDSEKCFNWLINPVSPVVFHSDTWERKPLHIRNRSPKYYSSLFSCDEFNQILRNNSLEYKKNIDIVIYRDGQRENYEADGRAYAPMVWDHFQNGYSVRLLNPQTYSKAVWKLCSLLQEYFGSFVGANMYLTPAGSQGFAPHYDDIEAFVLQIEGRKQWRVYSPRSSAEVLPRHSSKNFAQDELGDPILEVELQPGDLLYFPRGYIHQANTPTSSHSLHLTISTYQMNTWGDLLEKILPHALKKAMEQNVAYRESLPKDYMNYMGGAYLDKDSPEKEHFIQKVFSLTKGLTNYLQSDTGADTMMKDFIHSSHPPCLKMSEKQTSIHGNGEQWLNGQVRNVIELQPDTEIRLIRKRAVCLVTEEGKLCLYHSFENSRIHKEKDPQYIELDFLHRSAVEYLINAFPLYVPIENLPLSSLEDQMDLAYLLYDKGIIRTKVPLVEDDEEQ